MKKLMIICALPFLSGCWEIENGEKVGQVIDLMQSGGFFKTWECKIIRSGIQDGTGTLGSSIQLTIEDKNLLEKVKKYMLEKKFVSIKYHKEVFYLFRTDSKGYFIDSMEEIKK